MKIDYKILLEWIPRESEREKLTNLSKDLFETELKRGAAGDPAVESRRTELLDQISQTIQHLFRTMRRPMPTREEIIEMVKEHFGG